MTKEQKKSLEASIEWIMGRIHVGESDEFVTAEAVRRLELAEQNGKIYTAKERDEIIQMFLVAHRKNQGTYSYVMGGLR